MKKSNRKCVICATDYHYCPSCDKSKPVWMMSFCSENCKTIYEVCSRYNMKKIDEADARNILDKCDLTDLEHFTKNTQKIIKEILASTSVEVAIEIKEEQVFETKENVDEIIEEIKEVEVVVDNVEESVSPTPKKKKKKR